MCSTIVQLLIATCSLSTVHPTNYSYQASRYEQQILKSCSKQSLSCSVSNPNSHPARLLDIFFAHFKHLLAPWYEPQFQKMVYKINLPQKFISKVTDVSPHPKVQSVNKLFPVTLSYCGPHVTRHEGLNPCRHNTKEMWACHIWTWSIKFFLLFGSRPHVFHRFVSLPMIYMGCQFGNS